MYYYYNPTKFKLELRLIVILSTAFDFDLKTEKEGMAPTKLLIGGKDINNSSKLNLEHVIFSFYGNNRSRTSVSHFYNYSQLTCNTNSSKQ